jgi:phospholipid/cholesterol/gamma-HCH transport system permease protein
VSRYGLTKLANVGQFAWAQWDELRHVAAVIGTALYTSLRPRYWTRTRRNLFARQLRFVGVEPLGFVVAIAVFVGISVVVQLAFWSGEAGQSQLLGPMLVTSVARELGPLLISLVVIVRSGSAMTTQLAVLKIDHQVRALEERGSDPFLNLVVPRLLGVAVSTFSLTIVFILIAFGAGFLFSAWTGKGSGDLLLFVDTVSNAIDSKDVLNILAKTILPALFATASCCIGGLGVGGAVTEIPQVTQRALTRSIVGLFAISAVVSLLTYF